MNIQTAKAYRTISYDASCVIDGEPPIEILIGQKVQTYVNTKINNSHYDAPLEVLETPRGIGNNSRSEEWYIIYNCSLHGW